MERVSGVFFPPILYFSSYPGTLSAGCCFTIFSFSVGVFSFWEREGAYLRQTLSICTLCFLVFYLETP